jgi:hypothetical protein
MSGFIQRTSEVVGAALGDELLMMSVEMSRYFSLNAVGTRIWKLLENPTTEGAVVEQLVAEYDVESDRCRQAVAVFLSRLRERKLVAAVRE